MENLVNNQDLNNRFSELSTPLIADACVRLGLPLRIALSGIHSVLTGSHVAGRALPARHYGSVDIFLEAMESAQTGDILVIDNGGRLDEGCIGDLITLEAQSNGLAGILIWGSHRDTADIIKIGLPVFSCGSYPAGPLRVDPRDPDALSEAHFSGFTVTKNDIAFADADGVLFVQIQQVEEIISTAHSIWQRERRQAQAIQAGRKLSEQLRFTEYLDKHSADATYTFRQHLRTIGGAIEE